ncbi:MAG: phosphomannomutase/phosphoglucomutase [Pseudomonadota bacterium]
MQPQNNENNNENALSPHNFSPTILREYDIRGQIGKDLSEEDAYALGLSFGTYLIREAGIDGKVGKVCVGYDGRHSSPALAKALTRGLIATGHTVEQIGLGPTPMLYFSVKDRMAEAGIMVTGSHNPSDYNGFKMTLQSGPIFGEKIQRLGEIAATGDFESGDGKVMDVDVREQYVDRLMKDFTGNRALNIAWDAGNGAAGEILRMLTAKLPGNHTLLFDDIDGDFPNHHPDPTVDKNLVDLQKAVKDNGCDLGIAFDGDGDRIGVVDENGTVLRCDILMTIYAREVLEARPGAAIIGDVKCSQVMFDEINRLGGKGVMWKTGHSLIKDKMSEMKAPLAGELSGHIFFADKYYGFDDALYCAIRLLNEVCEAEGPLSTLTADLPTLFNTPEVRVEVDEDKKFGIAPQLIANLEGNLPDGTTLDDIDGIRIASPDGWWLLRPSNTQAVLVFRAESNSEDGLERLKDMALTELQKLGYSLNFE